MLARAVAGTGAVRIAALVASFAVGVQLARGLGVEGYGYYGIALSVVTIAAIPGELGLSKLVTREVATATARNDESSVFVVLRWADRTCWRMSAVIAAVIIIAGGVLMIRGSTVVGAAILLGLPTIPLIALARIRGGALQGLHHIVRGQVPGVLLKPLFLSLLLLVVFLLGGTVTPPGAMALNSVAAGIVLFIAHWWLSKRLPERPLVGTIQSGRRWLASSIPMALTDGLRVLQSELTILVLGVLTVAADVGLFRIAVATAAVTAAPHTMLVYVVMPVIARLHAQGETARLQRVVTYTAYAQVAGVLLLSLPLLLAPELLLSIVFGENYAPAANATRILAAGQIANAAFGPSAVLLNMTHHERRVTRAMAIALVVTVVLVPLLLSRWGLAGASLGLVAGLLCWNVLTWRDARRLVKVETSIMSALL